MGFDNSFDLTHFKENFSIKVISKDKDELVFDMIGIDAPVANAFRRILIAEVPTMAIEKIYLFQNTSIIQDEVLSHRVGLVPVKADPRLFEYREEGSDPTDADTLVFKLHIKCQRKPKDAAKQKEREELGAEEKEEDKYVNYRVTSKDLVWVPQGNQAEKFAEDPIRPVYDDILIARLRPGQEIELEAHCEKGVGKTHAKWSPVCTASYRLMPDVQIIKELRNEKADHLVKTCPMKVFDIEDLGKGQRKARVANQRNCSMCRECIREPEMQKHVKLTRKKDHFIFAIESVGILPAEVLFAEAVKLLMAKCDNILQKLDELNSTD